MSSSKLLGEIRAALRDVDVDTGRLHIEITESAIMENPEVATETLTELRKMGLEVHLDDFGTGYSSLGYLQRFPVDMLKIDRSFISMDGDGLGNAEIVRMITSLAQALSMKTTAEGIETYEQLEQLRSLHCTNGKGYYFARPMSADKASALIAEWPHRRFAGRTA